MLQVLCKEDAEVVSQASQRHLPVRGELKSRDNYPAKFSSSGVLRGECVAHVSFSQITLSHFHIFLVRSTTGRMCCTWDVWLRMPPLLNGFLTLAPISTGSNSQIKTNEKTGHKSIVHISSSRIEFDGWYERRCYGNFFCCDDQKRFRGDSKTHEPVDVPLKTNYLGEFPLKTSFLRSLVILCLP